VAQAQQPERMRRIGVLHGPAADDPEIKARDAAFEQELRRLGWTSGGNVQIDLRWGAGDADRVRKYAAELVMLAPDVIVTSGAGPVSALMQATTSVPIVFVLAADPVGAGFVDSLARPGHQVRAGDQSQDRKDPRPHRAADSARPSRRGARINNVMSAFDPKRTSGPYQAMKASLQPIRRGRPICNHPPTHHC